MTRGGLEEGRPREEAEKTLGEIQFSRKTKLGHGLVGLDAKGVSRGLIWEFYGGIARENSKEITGLIRR